MLLLLLGLLSLGTQVILSWQETDPDNRSQWIPVGCTKHEREWPSLNLHSVIQNAQDLEWNGKEERRVQPTRGQGILFQRIVKRIFFHNIGGWFARWCGGNQCGHVQGCRHGVLPIDDEIVAKTTKKDVKECRQFDETQKVQKELGRFLDQPEHHQDHRRERGKDGQLLQVKWNGDDFWRIHIFLKEQAKDVRMTLLFEIHRILIGQSTIKCEDAFTRLEMAYFSKLRPSPPPFVNNVPWHPFPLWVDLPTWSTSILVRRILSKQQHKLEPDVELFLQCIPALVSCTFLPLLLLPWRRMSSTISTMSTSEVSFPMFWPFFF